MQAFLRTVLVHGAKFTAFHKAKRDKQQKSAKEQEQNTGDLWAIPLPLQLNIDEVETGQKAHSTSSQGAILDEYVEQLSIKT